MSLVITRASKQESRYTPEGGRERCAFCRFYMSTGTCGRIIGPVSPRGWCRYYSREMTQARQPGASQGPFVLPGPSLDVSFMTPGALDPRFGFSRGSVATYISATGGMQTATLNAARWDYNPVTLALNGLLIEEQRFNAVRNGNATGSVPGTPGTMPTNWAAVNTAGGSVAFNIVGSGVEAGISYVDVRMVGTPTGTALRFAMETAAGIPAVAGQTWANSCFMRLVAGSMANITNLHLEFQAFDATQALLASSGTYTMTAVPTAAALASQRSSFAWTAAVSSGTIAAIRSCIAPAIISVGTPIDLTLRIGGVQLEQGGFATSYIPTVGASAVTRAVDVLTIPTANMASWFSAGNGSWVLEAAQLNTNASIRRLVSNGAGTAIYPLYEAAAGTLATSDGVILNTAGGITPGAAFKGGSTWGFGVGGTVCLNAGAVGSSAAMVSGFGPLLTNGVRFFADAGGAGSSTGYLRRLRYWQRALSNAELVTETT